VGHFEARIHPEKKLNPLSYKVDTKIRFKIVERSVSHFKRTLFLIFLSFLVGYFQTLLNSKGVCLGKLADPIHLDTIQDHFVDWTQPINDYFHIEPLAAQAAQAISSFFIDLTMILLLFLGGLRRSTVRPFFALFVFMFMRFIAQSIATFPCPRGFLWPVGSMFGVNIPTIFVDYHPANDLFFSGHCGTILVAAIELAAMDYLRTALMELFVVLPFVSVLVVSFRVHRGTDVFAGMFAAIAACAITERFVDPIDYLLLQADQPSSQDEKTD